MVRKRSLNKNKRKRNTFNKNKRKRNTFNKNKRVRKTLSKRKRIRKTLNKRKRNTFKRGGRKKEKDEKILMFVSQEKDNKYLKLSYYLNNDNSMLEYPDGSSFILYEKIKDSNKTSQMENNFNQESLSTIKHLINTRIREEDFLTYNKFYMRVSYEGYIIERVPILKSDSSLKIELIELGKFQKLRNNCYYKNFKKYFWKKVRNMTHKKILFYDYNDKIKYFNHLFNFICHMKNLDMSLVNIYTKPEDSEALEGWTRDESICYPDDKCLGSQGSVKIYKDNRGGRVALKSFNLLNNTSYDQDVNTLKQQFYETIINYKVKGGTNHNDTGSKHITEIREVLVNLPTKQFLENMMIDCLDIVDSIFFPSLIMEYAGEELHETYYKAYCNDLFHKNLDKPSDLTNIFIENRIDFLRQIAEGLQFMNENDFFHRDIKLQNICVKNIGDEYIIKIIDFGLTRESSIEDAKKTSQKSGSLMTF